MDPALDRFKQWVLVEVPLRKPQHQLRLLVLQEKELVPARVREKVKERVVEKAKVLEKEVERERVKERVVESLVTPAPESVFDRIESATVPSLAVDCRISVYTHTKSPGLSAAQFRVYGRMLKAKRNASEEAVEDVRFVFAAIQLPEFNLGNANNFILENHHAIRKGDPGLITKGEASISVHN